MNKTRTIIFAFVWIVMISPLLYGQSDTLNRTDKFGKKYGYWEKYESGKLLWKGFFYNGEPVGEFIYYHPNKKIKDKLYYYPNSPKVSATSYYSNGVKSSEGLFINKIKDGKWLYYSNGSKLVAEENYALGKKQGLFKLFSSEDGTLLQEEVWEKNILHGEHKEYYTTGALRSKWLYKNGKIDGAFENYYLDGKLWNKGQYSGGLRDGIWICYDRKGNEIKREEISREHITRTVLGFQTLGQWLNLDVRFIAYFYQNPGGAIYIQLWKGNKIQLSEDNSLVAISNIAGNELFIFLNENLLSSYESIKKLTETNENEAEIVLKPTPSFKVFTYDNYYKLLKTVIDTKTPEDYE
jgi:antitoxin component YwqK of YwqJK toxin-antitoxin module